MASVGHARKSIPLFQKKKKNGFPFRRDEMVAAMVAGELRLTRRRRKTLLWRVACGRGQARAQGPGGPVRSTGEGTANGGRSRMAAAQAGASGIHFPPTAARE